MSKETELLQTQGLLNNIESAPQPAVVPGRSSVVNDLQGQVVKSRQTDAVSGKREFLAVVLRDENRFQKTAPPIGSPQHIAPDFFGAETTKVIKVKASIPEIHIALPSPEDQNDHMVIGLYPTFVCAPETLSGKTPAVGEVIRVSFGDVATQSSPTIVGLATSGNKQSGADGQAPCKDTAKTAMQTVPPIGSPLNVSSSSDAKTPQGPLSADKEKNIKRAIEVARQVKAKSRVDIPVEILLAFMSIESKGDASAIRFEPHIFVGKSPQWMSVTGMIDKTTTPKKFVPRRGAGMRKIHGRRDAWGEKTAGVPYTRPKRSPYYSKKTSESNKSAFEHALTVDPYWAVYATSFGTYQVMGFNVLTDTNTKYTGKTPKKFYEDFLSNPEQVSDEMMVSWISKKRSWRNTAKHQRRLSPTELKKLIKLYNGSGQVDAYYYRIGGGLKKAYDQAFLDVEAYRRKDAVDNPPPPPPLNPSRTIREHKKAVRASERSERDARRSEQDADQLAAATCAAGGVLPTSLSSSSAPDLKNVRGGERPNNHSNTDNVACGQSARLGDSSSTTNKKDPKTGKLHETDEAFRKGKSLGEVQIRKIKTKGRKAHNFVLEVDGIFPSDLVEKMISSAKSDGINLQINSGFRTNRKQKQLYDKFKRTGSPPTARPGRSKHQSGTAVDFQTGGGTSPAYFWLVRNAINFGFVRTVKKETWHWVYLPNINDTFKYVPRSHTEGKGAWPSFVKDTNKVTGKKNG